MKTRIILTAVIDVTRWLVAGKRPWWAFWKSDTPVGHVIAQPAVDLILDMEDPEDRQTAEALALLFDRDVIQKLLRGFGDLESLDIVEGQIPDDIQFIDREVRRARQAQEKDLRERYESLRSLVEGIEYRLAGAEGYEDVRQRITEELQK